MHLLSSVVSPQAIIQIESLNVAGRPLRDNLLPLINILAITINILMSQLAGRKSPTTEEHTSSLLTFDPTSSVVHEASGGHGPLFAEGGGNLRPIKQLAYVSSQQQRTMA